jgi:Family of unknown function (DUF6311)/Interleukin-like EMT inducer
MLNTANEKKRNSAIAYLLILVAVAVIFYLKFGFHILNPMSDAWTLLLGSDRTADILSWENYRNTPFDWRCPSKIEGFCYPIVVSTGLTGATPLVAMPLKLLNDWLPLHFQFFGLWLLTCWLLQGYFALRLMRALGIENAFVLALTSIFFLLAPPLLERVEHINLCPQWVILAGFWLYFDKECSPRRRLIYSLVVTFVAATTHPYFPLFTLAIGFATFAKMAFQEKITTKWSFLTYNVYNIVVWLLAWWIAGNFIMPVESVSDGLFGFYSANLNTFVNPVKSTFFHPMKIGTLGQYEGFAYLGASIILLGVFFLGKQLFFQFRKKTITQLAEKQEKINVGILFFVTFVLFLFALSDKFYWNDTRVLMFDYLGPMVTVASVFRAAGRFVWALHYLILALVLWKTATLFKKQAWTIALLAIALTVQCVEFGPNLTRGWGYADTYTPRIDPKIWKEVVQEAKVMVVYPAFTRTLNIDGDFQDFSQLAYECKKPITTGYISRYPKEIVAPYTKGLEDSIVAGSLGKEPDGVYICSKFNGVKFQKLVEKGKVNCYEINNYLAFVPLKFEKTIQYLNQQSGVKALFIHTETLGDFLNRYHQNTILLSVRDEASFRLCDEAKKVFKSIGSKAAKLPFRASYLGVFDKGKVVFEEVNEQKQADFRLNKGAKINTFEALRTIEIHSGGSEKGNLASILVNEKEYSPNLRGFNLVVLDNAFNVIEKVCFDTFDTCNQVVTEEKPR